MKKQTLAALSRRALSRLAISPKKIVADQLSIEGVGRVYSVLCIIGYGLLLAADPASAQSLRSATESIYNEIYGVVGAVGGIAVVTSAINMKTGNFLGAQDPKKTFIHSIVGTGLAFGSVGIVQFIKTAAGSGSSISGV